MSCHQWRSALLRQVCEISNIHLRKQAWNCWLDGRNGVMVSSWNTCFEHAEFKEPFCDAQVDIHGYQNQP